MKYVKRQRRMLTEIKVPDPQDLKRIRLEKGLSLKTLASKLGVSATFLHEIEGDKKSCPAYIEKAYMALED